MLCVCVALTPVTRQRLLHDVVALYWRHCINGRHALCSGGLTWPRWAAASASAVQPPSSAGFGQNQFAAQPRAALQGLPNHHHQDQSSRHHLARSHKKLDKRFGKKQEHRC